MEDIMKKNHEINERTEVLGRENYTIEYCPWCENEQVIFSKGVTRCPDCGKPLAPCSVCEECVTDCPYGCDGINDAHKEVTNRDITPEEVEFMRGIL